MPPTEKTRTAEAKHTPTPWAVSSSTMIVAIPDKRDLAIICNTIDLVGISSIGIYEARANAELICKAVNSHAALQASNEEMAKALLRIDDEIPEDPRTPLAIRIRDIARSALTRSSLNTEHAK